MHITFGSKIQLRIWKTTRKIFREFHSQGRPTRTIVTVIVPRRVILKSMHCLPLIEWLFTLCPVWYDAMFSCAILFCICIFSLVVDRKWRTLNSTYGIDVKLSNTASDHAFWSAVERWRKARSCSGEILCETPATRQVTVKPLIHVARFYIDIFHQQIFC